MVGRTNIDFYNINFIDGIGVTSTTTEVVLNMDIAVCLENLLPSVQYVGSLTHNSEEDYNNLIWQDTREKPSLQDLEEYWELLELDLKWEEIRKIRDALIEDITWRVERYQQEVLLNITPCECIEYVLLYIQDLRNITTTYTNPDDVVWPEIPEEIPFE